MGRILVRHAITKDIEQIQKVASEAWRSTYEHLFSLEFIESFLEKAYSSHQLVRVIERSALQRDRALLVTVDGENRILGFAQVNRIQDGVYELTRIYVYPQEQHRGIGKQLLLQMLDHFSDWEQLYAWVEKDNTIACQYYQRRGFQMVDQRTEIIGGESVSLLKYVLVKL